MKNKKIAHALIVVTLVLGLSAAALADTIRLKDGSVIRGQIVGFRDQQFTVLIGGGARGRRSQITLYIEDVDSIEFDAAAGGAGDTSSTTTTTGAGNTADTGSSRTPQPPRMTSGTTSGETTGSTPRTSPPRPAPTQASPAFFQINVRVRGDNTSNGWTNSGLVVRRGQLLRINSSGRVSLGQNRFSTPAGLPRVTDDGKLMRNEATGGLIAVIGDDNDEFIFIGNNHEFRATRDGVLFLGVNEGNLNDNSGTYDAVIDAEAVSGGNSGGSR